jgi:hypothetical protein
MTQEQAVRIQRELWPGSGSLPNGEPFLTYGIWIISFLHGGIGRNVLIVDRPITSEADHQQAKEEAGQKLREAIARAGGD